MPLEFAYQTVRSRRRVQEVQDEPITLVWGACCPDTAAGNLLLGQIIAALGADYLP